MASPADLFLENAATGKRGGAAQRTQVCIRHCTVSVWEKWWVALLLLACAVLACTRCLVYFCRAQLIFLVACRREEEHVWPCAKIFADYLIRENVSDVDVIVEAGAGTGLEPTAYPVFPNLSCLPAILLPFDCRQRNEPFLDAST
jgi:hypothetical protein